MSARLDAVAAAHVAGRPAGITSVCSAHRLVIEAALRQGLADRSPVLIEATSNQVDQFGGYTGLTPGDFRTVVEEIAGRVGFPREDLLLGGDHLGPHGWRHEDSETAMSRAEDLVRSYVAAGYTKLHLDCSYPCADDRGALAGDVMAARASRMLQAAEAEAARVGLAGELRYVIGTEVPVPGGADHEITRLRPTTAASARATLDQHRTAFAAVGHEDVWPQVMALVVQPGVEFDHVRVFDYDSEATHSLRTVLDDEPTLVFEAHSTDYQSPAALAALVADGWGVLKVGPGLTFAMREALFALEAIEAELLRRGVLAARGRRGTPHAGAPGALAGLLHRHRRGAGARASVQLQRPHALLLAGPGDRGRSASALREPHPAKPARPVAERLLADAVRTRSRGSSSAAPLESS